ncbi:MAG: FecR domain-containing protein, partial [Bacteroidota bacterium]
LFAAVLTFLYGRDAGFERIVAEEARLVAFADGSEAKLAPGAVMMVPREGSDEDPRQARLLAGSALFDIERDPTQPFEVQTPNADVTVLGTTFGVDVEGEGTATHVVLASGRVRVAPREQADAAVELEPGQATRVAGLDAPEAPSPTDVATDLAWTGTVYARELSAAEVARRISAATGRPVTVDAGLAGESVSGTFHTDEGAQPALRTLALALDADLLRTPNDGFRLAR